MHDGDADALNVKLLHAREQWGARRRFTLDDDRWRKAALDLVDEVFCSGCGRGLRDEKRGRDEAKNSRNKPGNGHGDPQQADTTRASRKFFCVTENPRRLEAFVVSGSTGA
jgi:hypothetical protein